MVQNTETYLDKIKERERYISIPARDFRDGGLWHVLIPVQKVAESKLRGMGFAKELGATVPKILRNPKAVFQGIRFDEYEDPKSNTDSWLCYLGLPDQSYDDRGNPLGPYADEVFLVFVNVDRVVYHWRWEKCCPDNTTLPIDHAKRFRERIL